MNQGEKNYNWSKRQERRDQAVRHTEKMGEKYKSNISNTIFKTNEYNENYMFVEIGQGCVPEIKITVNDSVSEIFLQREKHAHGKLAVLNFASYKNPGGKFLDGSLAQEECLCMESNLYNVLSSFKDSFYKNNQFHLNRGLYKNRCLYTPDIVFIKNDQEVLCDVINCAAPNKQVARNYQGVTVRECALTLKLRIKFVLDIAQKEKVDTLILGAYGCGVFGQDPKAVSLIFRTYLKSGNYSFKNVVFAIPLSEHNENHMIFKETLLKQ